MYSLPTVSYSPPPQPGSPSRKQILLSGGPPWGFRTCGGRDTNIHLRIARVNPESKAAKSGVREGDLVSTINGTRVDDLTNGEVQRILKKSGPTMTLELISAKRMSAFEGSLTTTEDLESVGASSGVPKKRSTEESQPSSSKASIQSKPGPEGAALTCDLKDSQAEVSIADITVEKKGTSGKNKRSPSHSESVKTSSKKKSVEFNERSVDEPAPQPPAEDHKDKENQGVWTPGSKKELSVTSPPKGPLESSTNSGSQRDEVDSSALSSFKEPILPVWTPPSAASPQSQKKFRPVTFNLQTSPNSSPRTLSLERSLSAGHLVNKKLTVDTGSTERDFPSPDSREDSSTVEGGGRAQVTYPLHLHPSQSSPSVHLPKYQSPTVTLLQKAREGHLPKGALYLDRNSSGVQRSSSASGGFNFLLPQEHSVETTSPHSQQPSSLNPNDTLYELKKEEYRSTPTGSSRRAEFTPRKYEGVGPTTPEGVPISLKSGIASDGNEWYRRMYESLHVDKPHRKEGAFRSPYGGPTSGSWSEPEGYESDTYGYKYATLDRRKLVNRVAPDTEYLSPSPGTPTSIPGSIRFTPGRIEDYTPGNSSVAAKEIRRHKPTLQWALGSKDLGYESDSNLVIRKRQEAQLISPPPPLSPAEQRQVYVEIQKGGEVPLQGLRKPAPEKLKENDGPSPPSRNPLQQSNYGGTQIPPPPRPSGPSQIAALSRSPVKKQARSLMHSRPDGGFDEDNEKETENDCPLVGSGFKKQAHLSSDEPSFPPASPLLPTPVRYAESEVNIHYKAPVRLVEKDYIGEEELRKRQQLSMKRFYEEQRHRKFLAEIQDTENRRHTDNFTPSQKSPIILNRYEDLIDEPQRPRWREKTPDPKLIATALFHFVPQNSRELSFRKGDVLTIRRKLDSNWFEGEHNGAIGIFPSSYVEMTVSNEMDPPVISSLPEGQAQVRFSFTAASPVEMSIIKGETVVLTRRVDNNWYEGRIGSRRGIFPASYVHVLKEPPMDLTPAISPKGTASPASHYVPSRESQNFRNNYKPHDYSVSSDVSPWHNNTSLTARAVNNRDGRAMQSVPRGPSRSYSHNLTVDTRSDPPVYKAIYSYRPAHEDELELRENDVVHVLEKCDDGWFVGTSARTGLFGTFPGNYVERVC